MAGKNWVPFQAAPILGAFQLPLQRSKQEGRRETGKLRLEQTRTWRQGRAWEWFSWEWNALRILSP